MIPLKRDQFTQSGSPVSPVTEFGYDLIPQRTYSIIVSVMDSPVMLGFPLIMTEMITNLLLKKYCCYCNKAGIIWQWLNCENDIENYKKRPRASTEALWLKGVRKMKKF